MTRPPSFFKLTPIAQAAYLSFLPEGGLAAYLQHLDTYRKQQELSQCRIFPVPTASSQAAHSSQTQSQASTSGATSTR